MRKAKTTVPDRKSALLKPAGKTMSLQSAGHVSPSVIDETKLIADLRGLILSARQRVATVANSTTAVLYWHVGQRLLKENLQDGRAAYGKKILATVSRELCAEFGDGYSYSALTRMVRFVEIIPDKAIVVTLSQQLSWSHFLALLPIKDPLARDFYAEMCRPGRALGRSYAQEENRRHAVSAYCAVEEHQIGHLC
jgi:hypothetical protein